MATAKAKRRNIRRWLLLLPLPLVWLFCAQRGWLDFFENRTIDWRFHARGEIDAPVKVVYVDVDSRSIDDIGNFPWNRRYFATVASALVNAAHVRAVGFDFVLSPNGQPELADPEKLRQGDREIARFLFKAPPVVFAASFVADEFRAAEGRIVHRSLPLIASDPRKASEIEPPEITSFAVGNSAVWSPPFVGLIDTLQGDVRTAPAWVPTGTRPFYHEALELARLYWGLPVGSIRPAGDHLDFMRPDGSVQARMPLYRRQLVDINWFSAWQSPRNPRESFSIVYSYAAMLDSEKEDERAVARKYFAQDDWKDAVVLIGPVDPLLQDIAPTPMDDKPVPRVGLHGNLLKTIISGRYLRRQPPWVDWAETLGLTFAVAALAVAGGGRGRRYKFFAVVLLAAFVALGFVLFAKYDLILPMVAPVGAAFTTSFIAVGWQLIEEEKHKGRIKGMFSTYVSPALVDRMVESGEEPKLGGVEENITAYFSDIQSFSTFSEKLDPSHLVELMNEYLTACTDIVQAEGGTLDKYIGDAVVAIYGAPLALPDHAYRACVATLRVHARVAELREKWKHEGEKWPDIVYKLQTRIGLNSGLCVVGNMGSHTRFNYTMMGDNVNLAARMESGAKSWGVYSMCAEATKLACEQHGGDRVVFRPLGKIVVMGRAQAVPVFELAGLKETIAQQTRECLGVFEEGLAKYHARDWDGALAKFRQSALLEPNRPGKNPGVKNNPSLVYQEIVAQMKIAPPDESWDGVYVMKEK